jgi:hypothetical protein
VKLKQKMKELFILNLLFSIILGMNAQNGPSKCYSCTNCVEPFLPDDFRVSIQKCTGDNETKFLCKVSNKSRF